VRIGGRVGVAGAKYNVLKIGVDGAVIDGLIWMFVVYCVFVTFNYVKNVFAQYCARILTK